MVAPWWKEPCPNCRQIKLGTYSQAGALMAACLNGTILMGGLRAIATLAKGGASAYDWVECGNCMHIYLACEHCAKVFRPEELPELGDVVTCPKCGLRLV